MPEPERIASVVGERVRVGEKDFRLAEYLLEHNADWATEAICFHAQQCVEKYLKALLAGQNIDFPKTRDLEALIALLPAQLRPNLSIDEQKALTRCAITIRYPNDYDAASFEEAKQLVEVTRRIRDEARAVLPASSLR